MEIYEIGNTVKARILELDPSEIKEKDYLCVLSNTCLPVDQGVQQMIDKLPQREIKSIDWNNAVVTYKDGSTYTLATERVLKDKDNVIIVVSNLLRYIYSRDFTIDMLYFSKEEGIVDLSGSAVEDVQNRFVRTVTPFRKLLSADNTVLLRALEYRVCNNFRFSNDIDDTLRDRVDYIKPLEGTNEIFNRMLSRDFHTARNFFYTLERYPCVEEYFSISSGLKMKGMFSATEKATEEYKKSNVFSMKRSKKANIGSAFITIDPSVRTSAMKPGANSQAEPPHFPKRRGAMYGNADKLVEEELKKIYFNSRKRPSHYIAPSEAPIQNPPDVAEVNEGIKNVAEQMRYRWVSLSELTGNPYAPVPEPKNDSNENK